MPSLVTDSAITLITRALIFVLGILSSIIISRLLGPSLKGTYNIITLIIGVSSMFVLFGLGSANVYYGARDPKKLPALVGNSIVAAIVLGFIGVVVVELVVTHPFAQTYLIKNKVEVNWIRGLILLLPINLLTAYLREIVRATGRILHYNFLFFCNMLISFLFLVIFVWMLSQGLNGAVKAWVLSQVIIAFLTIWVVWRTVRKLRVEWATFYQCFTFGVKLYPGNIAQFLNYRLDIFLVGFFLTPVDVGFYALATSLAEKLWEMPQAIRTVLLHRVAGEADTQLANLRTTRISRVIFLFMGVICVLVALISYPLIYLFYGAVYSPAAPALMLLLPGIWLLGFGKLLAVHLSGVGRPEIGTYSAVVSLVITLIFDLLLIPRIGILGAAIASSLSYILATIVILTVFIQVTKLKLTDIIFIKQDDLFFLHRILSNTYHNRLVPLFADGKD